MLQPSLSLSDEEAGMISSEEGSPAKVPNAMPLRDLSLSPATEDGEEGGMDPEDPDHVALIGGNASTSDGRPLPSLHGPLTYRDLQFVGMFCFHVLLALLATSFVRTEEDDEGTLADSVARLGTRPDATLSPAEARATDATQLRSLCVVNVLFSLGWSLVFLYSPKTRFVQASCAFSTVGVGVLAFVLYCVRGNPTATVLAVIATLVAVVDALWLRAYRNGFDFVAVLFELVVHFLIQHPMLAYVTLGVAVVYTAWACWICTSLAYVGHGAMPWQVSLLFLYVHFYWTSNVLKNILTVVVSGTTMIWYYNEDVTAETSPQHAATVDSSNPDSPGSDTADPPLEASSIYPWKKTADRQVVAHYVRCALTSSFGSICIGSLLCPIAHILWNVLRWARRDESVLSKRIVSLHSPWVEHFIRTYHKYSFVHVAAYGKPFWVAAQDAWKLIEAHGVEAIVDDDLTSRLLLFGANGWASFMAALCVSAFSNTEHMVYFAIVSFVLSYTALSLTTQVLAAVIKTLFVCFAENPTQLSQLHPLLYHRFARLAELKAFHDHKSPSLSMR